MVRESRMPVSRPDTMVSTTAPRCVVAGEVGGERDEQLRSHGGETNQGQRHNQDWVGRGQTRGGGGQQRRRPSPLGPDVEG